VRLRNGEVDVWKIVVHVIFVGLVECVIVIVIVSQVPHVRLNVTRWIKAVNSRGIVPSVGTVVRSLRDHFGRCT